MKRLIIICEGTTEFQFCMEFLYDHFLEKEIIIQCIYPKWSHGGHIAWPKLQKLIIVTLQKEPNAYLTTFIDLYGLHQPEQFPRWNEALTLKNKPYERVEMLEHAMLQTLPDVYRQRFIANMVLHEFEGLLFNDLKYFDDYFEEEEFKDRNELISILKHYPNPELINDTKATSPSHRLDGTIFYSFKKTVDGIEIAKKIGLTEMRKKAKHFDDWITRLENI